MAAAAQPHPAHWADLAGHGRHFLGSLQEEGSMPTQTTDLFLLEDLEETRSKREPLVSGAASCNSPKWCRAGENMTERLGHVDDGLTRGVGQARAERRPAS